MRIILDWSIRVIYTLAITIGIILNLPRFTDVDPKLEPYRQEVLFLTEGKLGHFTKIGFDKNIGENTLGNCRRALFGNDIGINPRLWRTISHQEKIVILAHELLHCEKDVDHVEGYGMDGFCPKHIMHPQSGGYWCIKSYFDEYMEQAKGY